MTEHSDLEPNQRLRDALFDVAGLWVAATGRSLGALSSVVSNYGGTLERLRDPAKKVTDATLEEFASFLVDPVNWPEGAVPAEAGEFAHRVGVTAPRSPASTGKGAENSREDISNAA